MQIVSLSPFDLFMASLLLFILAFLSARMRLELSGQIIIAGLRTTVQLLLIGLVLKALFAHVNIALLALIALVMLLAAGREIIARQKRKLTGWWGYGIGLLSISISSFSITMLALAVIIDNKPWYEPQYSIPLLGMLMGNTMNGISLGLDRLYQTTWEQKMVIEARLMLGQKWTKAIEDIRRESIRSGMIPIINSMAVAGIVSLPGMMTGQILAGSPPVEAVKYQILIMFMIAGGTGLGTMAAVWIASQRLFDRRHRLRLDRLKSK